MWVLEAALLVLIGRICLMTEAQFLPDEPAVEYRFYTSTDVIRALRNSGRHWCQAPDQVLALSNVTRTSLYMYCSELSICGFGYVRRRTRQAGFGQGGGNSINGACETKLAIDGGCQGEANFLRSIRLHNDRIVALCCDFEEDFLNNPQSPFTPQSRGGQGRPFRLSCQTFDVSDGFNGLLQNTGQDVDDVFGRGVTHWVKGMRKIPGGYRVVACAFICPTPQVVAPPPQPLPPQPLPPPAPPIPIAPPPTGLLGGLAAAGPACFSADTFVRTRDGIKSMDSLKIGDEVQVLGFPYSEIQYEPIEWFQHFDPAAHTQFMSIKTARNHSLTISPNHLLIFVECDPLTQTKSAKFAKRAEPGQCVLIRDDSAGHSIDKIVESKLETEGRKGLFAPVTRSGTIVVNDMVASCFSSIESEYLQKVLYWLLRYFHTTDFGVFEGVKTNILQLFQENNGIPSGLRLFYGLGEFIFPKFSLH